MFGLLLVVLVAGWAAVGIRRAREAEAAEAQAAEAERRARAASVREDPFGEGTRVATGDEDPFGNAAASEVDEAVWAPAEQVAARAEAMYAKAVAAKQEGDRALLVQQGRAALELFQEALADTLELEEALIARYGERHAETRKVVLARDAWFDRVLWLKKSALH